MPERIKPPIASENHNAGRKPDNMSRKFMHTPEKPEGKTARIKIAEADKWFQTVPWQGGECQGKFPKKTDNPYHYRDVIRNEP